MEKLGLEKLRGYAASSRSQASFGGCTFLKLDQNDGKWKAGKASVDMAGRKLVADLPDTMGGFQRLEAGKKPAYALVRILDDVAQVERSELGELDEKGWIDTKDPWQAVTVVPLFDLETRQIFVYTASTGGARDAVANLIDAYVNNCASHPEAANKLPVLELNSGSYIRSDGKTVFTPLLDLINWIERPAAILHIKPPPTTIATAEKPDKSTTDDKAKVTAKPKRKISVPGVASIDDEIPF